MFKISRIIIAIIVIALAGYIVLTKNFELMPCINKEALTCLILSYFTVLLHNRKENRSHREGWIWPSSA